MFCVISIHLLYVALFGNRGQAEVIKKNIKSHSDADNSVTWHSYHLTLRYGENGQFSDDVEVSKSEYNDRYDIGSVVEIKYIRNTALLWQGLPTCHIQNCCAACGFVFILVFNVRLGVWALDDMIDDTVRMTPFFVAWISTLAFCICISSCGLLRLWLTKKQTAPQNEKIDDTDVEYGTEEKIKITVAGDTLVTADTNSDSDDAIEGNQAKPLMSPRLL